MCPTPKKPAQCTTALSAALSPCCLTEPDCDALHSEGAWQENPEDSQKHNPARLISLLPLLSRDAARLSVIHPPMQQRPVGTQHRQFSIVKFCTTDEKSQTYEHKESCVVHCCGQQMVGHTQQSPEPYNVQQTLQRAAKIPPAQMEARNPHSPSPSEGCHDAGSPSQNISKGRVASR